MELKEYLNIIKKEKRLFWLVVVIVISFVGIYFYFQPAYYDTSLTANITRLGRQTTKDYQYDDFYRLQADEKFADTVARWVVNPRTAKDVYSEVGIDTQRFNLAKLSQSFSAQKQSSQIVVIKFKSSNELTAKKIADSLAKKINQDTQELNIQQQEPNWFYLIFKKPVIVKHTFNYGIIAIVSLLTGVFLGFWVVMFKYYFE